MAVILFTASCKKEDNNTGNNNNNNTGPTYTIPETNKAWYSKITATWCGPCGDWGWTLNDEITAAIGTDHVTTAMYSSSSSQLTNTTAVAFYTPFGGNGFPSFCMNGANLTAYSSGGGVYTTTTKSNIQTAATAFKSATCIAGVGANVKWTGTDVKVDVRTKFLTDGSGEYYVACYAIEDGVVNQQNVTGQGYVQKTHHNVFRGPVSDGDRGVQITATSNGQTFDKSFSMSATPWTTANVSFLLVIWKKTGTAYSFVNCNIVK